MAHQSTAQRAFVTTFSPQPEEQLDTLPSEYQPPGVDDKEPESLEEALTSWKNLMSYG